MTRKHPSVGSPADANTPARAVAATVLSRVWQDGAFASAALDAALRRSDAMDARDAALATELVYGVLRTQAHLEERLAVIASRRSWAKDLRVRAHVLIGAYSIAFLDRVPVFAAVSEAVEGARAAGGDRMAGFANAVLRRLAGEVDAKRPDLADAVVASAPGWLRGALRRSLGRRGAKDFLAAGPVPPPVGLCAAQPEERDRWIDALQSAAPGATIEAGKASPRAILVRGAGDIRRLVGAGDAWIPMEEGAQAVTLAAEAKPGERVLDACAGHGNKTWLLAREVGPDGVVDASDLVASKLEQLRAGPAGSATHATFTVDWTQGAGDVPEGYDLVVVDAPCSGVGTLRRRPEIAASRSEADVRRLAALQASIVRRAATRARDGGRLLFAVCSVLREEGEEVVARLVDGEELGVRLEATGDALRWLPQVQGTDGYFAARFVVRRLD